MSFFRFLFIGFCLGLSLGLAIFVGSLLIQWGQYVFSFESTPAISEVQIRRIGEAVKVYAAKEGGRPGNLNAMVTAGMLSQDDLYDEHRKKRPVVEIESGVEISPPDVIYFPALRPSDPPDCVLLCTVLLREKGGKFHVIYNDGRYAALTARELVMALNHTYEHIGKVLATESEVRSQESGDRSQEIEVRS
ncbi:MAG TPA: hypothetical protein ENH84_07110 [Phycisphaerae bacterium]|nr:hypothetical protein [Phycisphaerae bacterium]